jgi:hypothetical protein
LGTAAHALAEHVLCGLATLLEIKGFEVAVHQAEWSARNLMGCIVWLDESDDAIVLAKGDEKKAPPGFNTPFPVDEAMVYGVDVYLETVHAELERLGPGTQVVVERRFDLTWVFDGMEIPVYAKEHMGTSGLKLFGTNDCCLVQPFGEVVVVDYKNGRVPVEVEGNAQVLYYGLGSAKELADLDFTALKMVIVQPNCIHQDGAVRDWSVDRAYLLEWKDRMAMAALRTVDPEAPLIAGSWCDWCEARPCKAQQEQAYLAAQADFDDEGLPSVPEASRMTDEEIGEAIKALPVIEAYAKALRGEAHRRMFSGSQIAGQKLVRKKTNRAFPLIVKVAIDEVNCVVDADTTEVEFTIAEYIKKRAEGLLSDPEAIYAPRKLLSPAQIEKLGGTPDAKKAMRALVKELAFKPDGSVTVAPDTDPRPAIDLASVAGDDFEEFDEEGQDGLTQEA